MGRGAILLFFLAIFAVGQARAEALKVVSESTPPQYGVTRFIVHSERIGRDFRVIVSQPAATVFLPGQKLPAIYALDGGNGIAGPQGQYLSNAWLMSAALVISVDDAPNEANHRLDDLAHARWRPQDGSLPEMGGGGAAFEAFLLEDLRPFIEARYATDPRRAVLLGHSLGALFAANIFARQPDAFAGYIMASVPVWAEPGVVQRVAAAAGRASGQRVYLAVAEFDDGVNGTGMQPGFQAMSAALKRPGVTLKTQVYPGENHSSYYPRMVLDGFPFVLPSVWSRTTPQWPLPPDIRSRYEGTYRMPDGREITIRAAPPFGRMTAQVAGGPAISLVLNGRDRFYAPSSDLDVVFEGTSATLSSGDARVRIEKAP
ncbi:alpha/beta hydrolase-fold protein [Phenylobacterium sp.]|uniref:alpha/beta hydrolase n=1 Tax=Phenylobacterium sp. TaxID=1871053 RepID=UPI0025FE2303|nr:alpha/beta hydrolase-fold protein [Phenylobacterium sp.]MBX3483261.1 alpha/beta hydrolase [Phenylobacterium sp.]MCW5759025.1 alpha/beta hydrolase [Phenylobacterium sp.]